MPSVEELRPITLQSCEYKILAKIFTKRIPSILDSVIEPWQHCAVPRRKIQTPLMNTISTIEYANQKNIDAYFLSMDILIAYDRTHVGYILQIMKRMGYTPHTLEILELLLQGCKTTIQAFDGIIQGLRQGCLLSDPLFMLNMEPLIRKLPSMTTGIQIGGLRQAVEGFMDGVNVFSTRRSDLPKIDDTFKKYELSCTLLSWTKKTKILGLSRWKEEVTWELPWVQPVKQLRVLGIQVARETTVTYQLSCDIVIKNVKTVIQQWISRKNISLAGKVIITNMLILAKVWYTGQIIPIQQDIVYQIKKQV